MTGTDLKDGRRRKGWTQENAARRLGVSQPYLSLLENGTRRVPEKLAHQAAGLFGLSPARLPMKNAGWSVQVEETNTLASDLAALRYPGLSHLESVRKKNPAEVLLSALSVKNLDARLTEALPWILVRYADLDWEWLFCAAKVNDLQNKLGFLISVARRFAENLGKHDTATLLRDQETVLERSRLMKEETLCHDSLSQAERRWLKSNRTAEARHWNLLTDLAPEHLTHGL